MSKKQGLSPESQVEEKNASELTSSSRRKFLGGLGGVAAATAAVATVGLPKLAEAVEVGPQSPIQRANSALLIRTQAALAERALPIPAHPTNGDEERYATKIASFSKGLPHNQFGEVNPAAFNALVKAMSTGQPADFEAIPLGSPDPAKQRRLIDPQAALAFDLEGADSHHLAVPPVPLYTSAEYAGELVELYWQALMRDVPFTQYATHPLAQQAIADLNRLSDFRGPKINGKVTAQTLFRGIEPGATAGPLISQFLLGNVGYGSQTIDTRVFIATPGVDYMHDFASYLSVQNGVQPGAPAISPGTRYILNGRDIASFVHVDALYQAYLTATLVLLNTRIPYNKGNPYGPTPEDGPGQPSAIPSRVQAGFGTFGGPHILTLVCEVATRALHHIWYQKWSVHRRGRPERAGGVMEVLRTNPGRYPSPHADVTNSAALPAIFARNAALNGGQGTYLLNQAFPEGSPTHPSYGSGHATVAGACITVLKAFFDESAIIPNPVVPSADGTTLVPYTGADAGSLTVGGELNKVATNIAYGRDHAGVHWRGDQRESMLLGEQVGISILRDQYRTYNQVKGSGPGGGFKGYTFTKLDGTKITV
jgi:hypothetical protein